MSRKGITIKAVVLLAVVAVSFIAGWGVSQATFEPRVVIVEVPVELASPFAEVPVIIGDVSEAGSPVEFRQFVSRNELTEWLDLNPIGNQEGWVCVDYALEMQRRALLDGYQMSTELVDEKFGHPTHMVCLTVIGNEIILIEPQDGRTWLGGIVGGVE